MWPLVNKNVHFKPNKVKLFFYLLRHVPSRIFQNIIDNLYTRFHNRRKMGASFPPPHQVLVTEKLGLQV